MNLLATEATDVYYHENLITSIALKLLDFGQDASSLVLSKNFSPWLWIFWTQYKMNRERSSWTNSPVSQFFSPSSEQPKQCIIASKSEQPSASCIEIFHKYCWYIKHWGIITNYNKFINSLGLCHWHFKIPHCRYMEHGLEYIMFYVQNHMAPLAVCSGPPLVHDKLLEAAAETCLL